jgi:hypothetical protein
MCRVALHIFHGAPRFRFQLAGGNGIAFFRQRAFQRAVQVFVRVVFRRVRRQEEKLYFLYFFRNDIIL